MRVGRATSAASASLWQCNGSGLHEAETTVLLGQAGHAAVGAVQQPETVLTVERPEVQFRLATGTSTVARVEHGGRDSASAVAVYAQETPTPPSPVGKATASCVYEDLMRARGSDPSSCLGLRSPTLLVTDERCGRPLVGDGRLARDRGTAAPARQSALA